MSDVILSDEGVPLQENVIRFHSKTFCGNTCSFSPRSFSVSAAPGKNQYETWERKHATREAVFGKNRTFIIFQLRRSGAVGMRQRMSISFSPICYGGRSQPGDVNPSSAAASARIRIVCGYFSRCTGGRMSMHCWGF